MLYFRKRYQPCCLPSDEYHLQFLHLRPVLSIRFPHQPFHPISKDGLSQTLWHNERDTPILSRLKNNFKQSSVPLPSLMKECLKFFCLSEYFIFGKAFGILLPIHRLQ